MQIPDNYTYRWRDYVLWPFRVFVYYVGLFMFVAFTAVVNLCTLFTAFVPADDWRVTFYQKMIRALSRLCFAFYDVSGVLWVESRGFDLIEKARGVKKPILIANHPSLLDVFMFYEKLPRLTCIYKASLGKTALKGSMGRQIGFISNANTRRMIREGAEKVAAGEQMLVFPEGTRTARKPVNPFRLGAIAIAKKAGVKIQAVHIFCNSNMLSKQRPIWAIPQLPIRVVLEVGEQFDPSTYERHQDLNREMELYFMERLEAGPRV